MKVVLDRSKCTGLGICESVASSFFEVDDNGDLLVHKEDVGEDELASVEDAVNSCPTEALRIVRASDSAGCPVSS
ncbi:ferredoxin [Rhodococcus aetherivorans]|uniref:ferredoxin n=1 Tax=Rhodococcus aetherivorans TaxID=191292 RepID=UPI0009DBFDC4|nr:ferredoxin [Rhodococcus aetherivorans]